MEAGPLLSTGLVAEGYVAGRGRCPLRVSQTDTPFRQACREGCLTFLGDAQSNPCFVWEGHGGLQEWVKNEGYGRGPHPLAYGLVPSVAC